MANTTIARPYAKAAFEYALAQHALPQWSAMLGAAALIVQDSQLQPLLNHPKISQEQLAEVVIDLCGKVLSKEGQNFLQLLAQQRRLAVLPEIYRLYEQRRAKQEQTLAVIVASAFPLETPAINGLTAALSRRFEREVQLTAQIDETLLGGAMIKIPELDFVIDGSVRGKLASMADTLAT